MVWFFALISLACFILAVVTHKKRRSSSDANSLGNLRKCPKCAELIQKDAVICRFCQSKVLPVAETEKQTTERGKNINVPGWLVAVTIVGAIMICIYIGTKGSHLLSVGKEEIHLQKDGLLMYDELPTNVDLYVLKKNGTYDERPNDLEELCKDFLYYRKKILEDPQEAADTRKTFQQVNADLSEYHEEDVQRIFTLIEKSGYKAP